MPPAFVTAVSNRHVDAVLALSDAGEDDSDPDSAAAEPEATGPTIAVARSCLADIAPLVWR